MLQKTRPFEIIVVDNASTDGTFNVARSFGVRVIKEPKQGLTFARNTGFDAVRGDIIARCDADVILPNKWVEVVANVFQDAETVAASGPADFHSAPLARTFTIIQQLTYFKFSGFLLHSPVLYGPNYAVRKAAWQRVRTNVCLSDKQVHEDLDLSIHLLPYGRIQYEPKMRVKTSSRRLTSDLLSFLADYPLRYIKTLARHQYGLFNKS